jgi:uncharacterized membrane protein
MATNTDAPVDLYVAAYADADAARADWDVIKQLATDDVIKVEGLILVSRRSDGKIHVDDDFPTARKGAKWGAIGGAVVGLIFPPSLLAGALVGAGAGLVGGLVSHGQKAVIKADVEDALPLNSSGIVALFDEQWATDVDKALGKASKSPRTRSTARAPTPSRPPSRTTPRQPPPSPPADPRRLCTPPSRLRHRTASTSRTQRARRERLRAGRAPAELIAIDAAQNSWRAATTPAPEAAAASGSTATTPDRPDEHESSDRVTDPRGRVPEEDACSSLSSPSL